LHKEASSELYWLANFLDGKISFIFWTHTHIQTNDDMILSNKTWVICDVWMSWPLYSVIWADFESVKKRFLSWINRWKIEQALWKEYVVSGVFVEIWDDIKCEKIEKIRIINK
jgi:calcineurin-like phosphoesterase